MYRNDKTSKTIAMALVTLITATMLGVSPTLAEEYSCRSAVGDLAASGAACLAAAKAASTACAFEFAGPLFLYQGGLLCFGVVSAAAITCGDAVQLSTIWTFVRCYDTGR